MINDFCKECADFDKCMHNKDACPYFEDEQVELEEKAKKMPRKYEKSVQNAEKKPKKPKTVKISQEKQQLFSEILTNLKDLHRNVQVLRENKLILVQIDDKIFKIDIIEQRPPK